MLHIVIAVIQQSLIHCAIKTIDHHELHGGVLRFSIARIQLIAVVHTHSTCVVPAVLP